MVYRLSRRLKKNSRGVSAIEFAIVLPVLVVLVMGIIEFGWILNGHITLTGAAREGVRAAVTNEDSTAAATAAVNAHVESMDALSVGSLSLNPPEGEGVFGEEMTLSLSGTLPTLIGFFDWLGNDGVYSLAAEATMRYMGAAHGKPSDTGAGSGADDNDNGSGSGNGNDSDNDNGSDTDNGSDSDNVAPALIPFDREGNGSTLTISFDKPVGDIEFSLNQATVEYLNSTEVSIVFNPPLGNNYNNSSMTINVTGLEGETSTYIIDFQNDNQGWSSN